MATNNTATALEQVEIALNAMRAIGVSEEQIAKHRAELLKNLVEPAKKALTEKLLDAGNRIAGSKVLTDNIDLLKNTTISVYITIDKDGRITVGEKMVTVRSSGGPRRTGERKRGIIQTVNANGEVMDQYETWAKLCDAYKLAVKGDSARRVWERAHKKDPNKYPAAEEVQIPEEESETEA